MVAERAARRRGQVEEVDGNLPEQGASGHEMGRALEIQAGAARLNPPSQTCTHPDGSRETRTYWAISSDGASQTEILRAEHTSERGACVAVIAAGERTREHGRRP